MVVRTRQDAARVLSDASGDKRFFCHDGCVSANLYQLADCLEHMSEDFYHHHATAEKNDFANWVRDVFGDDKLASSLSLCSNRAEAVKVIRSRITWLQKKLK